MTAESTPSMVQAIEGAETPWDAAAVVAERLSPRRVVSGSVELGRNVLKIVMNGDVGEMLGSAANRQ